MFQGFSDPARSMGSHVLLNLYECDEDRLRNGLEFNLFALLMLSECNAVVLSNVHHCFGAPGYGFTALYLLSTSHYSVHTWPETASAAVDVFTCGDQVDVGAICDRTGEFFKAGSTSRAFVLR